MQTTFFPIPRFSADNGLSLGRATILSPGSLSDLTAGVVFEDDVHPTWVQSTDRATGLARSWDEWSTVRVVTEETDEAVEVASEAMAVLRFLLRQVVTVNVDFHRIGLVGEVANVPREYVVGFNQGLYGDGWFLADNSVTFRLTAESHEKLRTVPGLGTLLSALERPDPLSQPLRRAVEAIRLVDSGFLARDQVLSVIAFASAVEVLLSDERDSHRGAGPLTLAQRAAFLTCADASSAPQPACPYLAGFDGYRDVVDVLEQWDGEGEWRCTAFLNIARPEVWEDSHAFSRRSLFGARHGAVHKGTPVVDKRDLSHYRHQVDQLVIAYLRWLATSAAQHDYSILAAIAHRNGGGS